MRSTTFFVSCRKRRATKSDKQRAARIQELARFRIEPFHDWGLRHLRVHPLRIEQGIVFPEQTIKPRVTVFIPGQYRVSLACDVLSYACQPSAVRLFVNGVKRGSLLLPSEVCDAGYESRSYVYLGAGDVLEFLEHVASRLEVSCGVFLRRAEISMELLQTSSF